MIKRCMRIFAVLVMVVCLVATGGVYASWNYATGAPDDSNSPLNVELGSFNYVEGDDDMIGGEISVADRFVKEINKVISNPSSTTLDEIVEARQDRSWFTINEIAADDPNSEGAQLRELLGLSDFPELTVIIKFINSGCGYELFTTRVDVDEKDEFGHYVIPESEFANETTYIYPVNRTTFVSDGKGGYVADKVTVGYSRTIYYYDYQGGWGNSQSTKTRTYDVSTWAEGTSYQTAVTIESGIIGDEITVQNIETTKEVYFKFTVSSRGKYAFTTSTSGLSARIYNTSYSDVTNNNLSTNTTYYLKLTYNTTGQAEDFKFTLSKQ